MNSLFLAEPDKLNEHVGLEYTMMMCEGDSLFAFFNLILGSLVQTQCLGGLSLSWLPQQPQSLLEM
jgi:hypothetical protein